MKCIPTTWYLATDMQYHWISLLAVIALLKNLKFGLFVNALYILGFVCISIVLIFINDFPPGFVNTSRGYLQKIQQKSN